jgi:RNA polymerase sigma-70 factor (ECF subfamily)
MPDEPEVMGLLALMLPVESRRAARATEEGDLVVLADQDRRRWDGALVEEGQPPRAAVHAPGPAGPYQVQAAINAVHSEAHTAADADRAQIVRLYDLLLSLEPGPVVALNQAVAGRRSTDRRPRSSWSTPSRSTALFDAVRANLLARLGRGAEAALAYDAAIARTENAVERRFLEGRRDALT